MSNSPAINRPILHQVIDFHRRHLQFFENMQKDVSCESCLFYTAAGECDKFKAAPPPDVKKVGCDEWTHDDIPF